MNDPAQITAFHAHVYYPDGAARAQAEALRGEVAALFRVALGDWRDRPVGPHPMAMYQISFRPETFAGIVPWLMLNRRGLSILIHPVTGETPPQLVADHGDHALWLGPPLPLDLSFLAAGNTTA